MNLSLKDDSVDVVISGESLNISLIHTRRIGKLIGF